MENIKGKTIVVWFSCGAASAVALAQTIDLYGEHNTVIAANNPIVEEDADNQRFLRDVGKHLGVAIERVVNPNFPEASCQTVWEKTQFMSGVYGASCTTQLKKNARAYWEANNHYDYIVLGFHYGEAKRARDFRARNPSVNLITPLIDSKTNKKDCFEALQKLGISPPDIYNQGYPNANCKGCVKATSPTYWNHVRVQDPEVFEQRAKTSKELGVRLVRVKGKRLFLDELDPNAVGRPMHNMDFECGTFCMKTTDS